MSKFPLVEVLEKHWEGCGWSESLPIHLPLIGFDLYDEDPELWREAVANRQIRFRRKAEKYLERHPEVFTRLMSIPQEDIRLSGI